MLPTRLGRYEILAELGRGAMGRVYRARDPIVGREVAIKSLNPEEFPKRQRGEVLGRFRHEAQAVGQLNHPHIIKIFDVGESFFVMELLKGETLHAHLGRRSRLSLEDTLGIVAPIAAALDYAHGRGVVHRDVKPANIMLTGRCGVKLMDFGIAHLNATILTRAGQSLGSPAYMSPEQIQGLLPTPRADLYSLAVVTYELLTGARPFTGKNITTLMYQVVHDAPPPPRRFNASLPPRYDELFERALSKAPEARFENAAAFVTELNLKELEAIVSTLTAPELAPPRFEARSAEAWERETSVRTALSPSASATERRPNRQSSRLRRLALLAVPFALLAAFGAWLGLHAGPSRSLEVDPPAKSVTPNPARSFLSIASTPSQSAVLVDGKDVGLTPLSRVELEEGPHEIDVRRSGYESFRVRVEGRPGESLHYVARLKPLVLRERVVEPPPGLLPASPEVPVAELGEPGVEAPRKLWGHFASYPEAARARNVTGTVVVSMVISEAGVPEQLAVVESGGPLLDEAVVEAVSIWRFAPASRDGDPVRVRYLVRQQFRVEP